MPRNLTAAECLYLASEYESFYNCNPCDAIAATVAGGDDPVALGLNAGDSYSILCYCPGSDSYGWNHDNRAEPETGNNEDYDPYEDHVLTSPIGYFL